MADDFFNCPNTGGKEPCNPNCLLFIREHNRGYTTYSPDIPVEKVPNSCRQYGRVDREQYANIRKAIDGGE